MKSLTRGRGVAVLAALLFLVLVSVQALAAVPQKLNYQGYLTNSTGTPVTATVTMVFSLYDVDTAGKALWSESRSVAVNKGYYSVNLGNAAINLPFDKPYYLGIKVGADAEMLPRQPITSVAYAFRASVADTVADGAITASKLGITCDDGQVLQKTSGGWTCGSVAGGGGTGGGSITGVTAGDGLSGGGVAGNVTLAVSFAGTGSAASAAHSDHDHDAIYQKKYGKVAVVAQSGADYSDPAAALADVSKWCGVPGSANPCLVKIMPGVYNLGSNSLQMLPFVDVHGSGSNNTILTGNVNSLSAGVVNGASNSELAQLTVVNSGGTATDGSSNASAIAIYNKDASPRLSDLILSATGATDNYAVYNDASSPRLLTVVAAVSGGSHSYAVASHGSGTVTIRRSTLSADTNTIHDDDGVTTNVTDTRFAGNGTVYSLGRVSCAGVYDAGYNFFPHSCPPNLDSPFVIATIPERNVFGKSAGTPTNTTISATFSTDMNAATITSATFTVVDASGSVIAGTVSYDTASKTALFAPKTALAPNASHTVTIKAGVRDLTGNGMAGDVQWSFTTSSSADTTPPTVISTTPADQATNVDPLASISVYFSEAVDFRSINSGTFTLVDAGGKVVAAKIPNASGQGTTTFLPLVPAAPLAFATTYTATIAAGIKDMAGNAMPGSYTWSFTTPAAPAPSGVSATASGLQATVAWSPVAGATSYNVYWSTNPFGQNPSSGSVVNKIPVPTGTAYLHTGLTEATAYYYAVTAVTAAGESPYSNTTSILIDTIPPTVTSTSPATNETNVEVSSPVCVNFSESINASTLNSSTVIVKDSSGKAVSGSLQSNYWFYPKCYGPAFFPSGGLNYGTTYTATVTSGIKDLGGNSLPSDFSWAFTTAPVSTPAGLTASPGNLKSTVTWPAAGGATSYNLYWSTTAGVNKATGTKITNVVSPYTHSGLSDGTTYYYVVTAVNGNGESAESNQASASIDTTVPSIVSTNPANNATGIDLRPTISANFSKQMSPTSLNAATVTLKDSAGNTVAGSVSALAYSVQFVPAAPLNYNATYTATISTGVKDVSGNQLGGNYSWQFTTVAVATPSGVTATAGNLNSTISWPSAAGATSYNIYWSTIPGVTKTNGTKIANVTSPYVHSGLADNTSYYYVVTAVNGNGESPESSQVMAHIDVTPPTVQWSRPADNATSVGIDTAISVNFSEYVTGVNTASFTLKDISGNPVNGSVNGWGNSFYFQPTVSLNYNTTYVATIGTAVKDMNGNALPAAFNLRFTTVPVAVPTGVTATAVPGNLKTTISWPVAGGATSYNIYWSTFPGVTKANGTKIANVTSPYVHSGLSDNTTYYYVVTAVNGNGESPDSNEASTKIDLTPPAVNWTTPTSGATGVAIGGSLTVAFSEPINSSTINNGTFTLKDNSGNLVNCSLSGGWNNSFQFTPSSVLSYNTTYTATITTGVKDQAGNALAGDYTWTFTTLPVATPTGLAAAVNGLSTTLTWPAAAGATSYNLYWSSNYTVNRTNGTKIANVTSPYVHSGLSDNTTYFYVVTAVNGNGESPESNVASARLDVTPPTVTWTNPYSNSNGIDVGTSVAANFSEQLDATTVNTATFILKDAAGNPVSGTLNAGWNSLQFAPSSSLNYNSVYTATITTGVKDLAGNRMASNYSWSFTTLIPVPTGLAVTKGTRQSNLTWTAVAGATSYNVYWSNSPGVNKFNGIKISGISSPSYSHSGLASGSVYYYVVTAVAGTAESEASAEVFANFDTTPPMIVSAWPSDGADPFYSRSIGFSFSENIRPETIIAGNFSLVDGDLNPVPFTISGGGSGINIYPQTGLKYDTSYTARVGTGIQDLAGNNLGREYVLTFRTRPLSPPPNVTATPQDGQLAISWGTVPAANVYYNIYWSNTPGVTKATGTKLMGAISPYLQSLDGNPYYFVVTTVSGDTESVESAEVNSIGLTPPQYVNAYFNNQAPWGTSTVELNWGEVAGADGYNIYWSTSPNVSRTNGTKISNVTSPYSQTGYPPGTAVYYVVTSFKGSVESAESAPRMVNTL